VIHVLLPVALLLSAAAVIAFIRAVRAGQFDDLETPRWRLLTDEDPAKQVSHSREDPPRDSRGCDGARTADRGSPSRGELSGE
jgi:cbb3-type cytochrome oxidase maturation protein